MPLEDVDQPEKSAKRSAQSVDTVADHCIDLVRLDVAQQPPQRRALQGTAREAGVIVVVVDGDPAFVSLAPDVVQAALALRVQAS